MPFDVATPAKNAPVSRLLRIEPDAPSPPPPPLTGGTLVSMAMLIGTHARIGYTAVCHPVSPLELVPCASDGQARPTSERTASRIDATFGRLMIRPIIEYAVPVRQWQI